MLGDTLGDAHNEGDFGGDGLLDTGGGERGPVVRGLLARLVSGSLAGGWLTARR